MYIALPGEMDDVASIFASEKGGIYDESNFDEFYILRICQAELEI